MTPNIAVVIVNWNKKEDVLNLLNDLADVSDPVFDVFVVDNASSDDSVDAIKNKFPNAILIINKTNLGGTGGFNSGIDCVYKKNKYEYIWLLDNDARIRHDTLSELVKAMESDHHIGLAGSRVVDIEDKAMTVETGGNFRWDLIGTTPVHRNVKIQVAPTVSVDYVAICSALIRVKALGKVGLMDDRLFLFWDDMDWGLCFKEKGFKVVAVSKSVVHHGSFTERDRGTTTNFYYGIRNAFLVYTKHTNFLKRSLIFYRSLRYYLRINFFFKTHNNKNASKLMEKAFSDFINNRWGKLVGNDSYNKLIGFNNLLVNKPLKRKKEFAKILVTITSGTSFNDNKALLKSLNKIYPEAVKTILVYHDRASYYDKSPIHTLDRKKMSNLWYMFTKFIKLKRQKFDAVATIAPSPFIYTAKQAIFFNKNGQILSQHRSGYLFFPLLVLALLCGEVAAHILFPIMLYKSFQYKKTSVDIN